MEGGSDRQELRGLGLSAEVVPGTRFGRSPHESRVPGVLLRNSASMGEGVKSCEPRGAVGVYWLGVSPHGI